MIATVGEPIETKVRALFELDVKTKNLISQREVTSAAGIKLIAPRMKDAIGGMPLLVANTNETVIRQQLQKRSSFHPLGNRKRRRDCKGRYHWEFRSTRNTTKGSRSDH